MSLNELINEKVEYVNSLLNEIMDLNTGYAEYLMEAMKYSVSSPGKRLRPILMMETANLFGNKPESIKYFMAAIEFIHSYSLVHDDMPCIDNDEYRRGRKTTHSVYGETTALLAGDGLLNLAYETAAASFDNCNDVVLCAKAMGILARKAGIFGMIGGQAADVWAEKQNVEIDSERLIYIHENKTAALLEASMMIGAVLAGASEEDVAAIEKAASYIGIAFQIRDDILDVEGSFEEFGKPIGSDEKNHKATYVSIFGMDKAKADVEKYSEQALAVLASFDVKNDFLIELVKSLIYRNK